jgi:hypothetical protein
MERRVICFPLRASALALLIACAPASAVAQVFVGSAMPRPGSAEIGGGGFWAAGQNVSSSAATLTGNPSNGASFDLFDADPELKPAIGAVGTIGVYVTRALAIEGAVQFSRPTLDVRLTNDAEDAPDVTASTTITSFVFTGSLVYHFGRSGRTTPFIAGGAGHIRDVHTGNEVVDTGVEYHGKAGVKSWFGRRRNVAFRAEAGISVRDGGFSFDEDRRIVPAVAASLLYLF